MKKRIFGEIEGFPEGSIFDSRLALSWAGVHRPTQAGISGTSLEGADSIVISGGYEDDVDNGVEIIYTGHGGNDPETGKQIGDQHLDRGNRALAVSKEQGLPVRVIRRTKKASASSSPEYSYDGLYKVINYWSEKGKSGYIVYRFHLVKV
jgi:putative restriction endonuclease